MCLKISISKWSDIVIEAVNYPKTKTPKGQIKIELFDDLTGKKKEEIEAENFISKGVRDVLFKFAVNSLFMKNKATGGWDTANEIVDPFRSIVLTDASHAEDPNNELLLKGRLLGYAYADNPFSGSDPLRGTYNTNESYTNIEQVHMVFDFPTHAANGTFESIYFIRDPIQNQSWYRSSSNFKRLIQEYITSIKKHGDSIYALTGSPANSKVLKIYDSDYNVTNTITLPTSFRDFEIVGSHIYFVTSSSSNPIRRAPLSDPTDLTTVVNASPTTSPQVYFAGICYDKGRFVVSSSGSSSDSSSNRIFVYDDSFNLISNDLITEFNSLGYNDFKLTRLSTGDIVSNYQTLATQTTMLTSGLSNSVRGEIGDYIIENDGYLIPKVGISSRSLLDSPVTKTSSTTMKITYDFLLPSIF